MVPVQYACSMQRRVLALYSMILWYVLWYCSYYVVQYVKLAYYPPSPQQQQQRKQQQKQQQQLQKGCQWTTSHRNSNSNSNSSNNSHLLNLLRTWLYEIEYKKVHKLFLKKQSFWFVSYFIIFIKFRCEINWMECCLQRNPQEKSWIMDHGSW